MRRAVPVAGALIAVVLLAIVVIVARDDGSPGTGTGAGTTTPPAGTTTAPSPAPEPAVPEWGDFPGAPPDLRAPAGGSEELTGSPGAPVLSVRRADGSVLATARLDATGAALEARYFDRDGSLTLAVDGLRADARGLAAGGARVRCASSAGRVAAFRWTRFPIRWRLGPRVAPGLSRPRVALAVRRARGTWNANRSHCRAIPDRSRARFAFAGPSARRTGRDGVSLVEFGDVRALGGVCAGTVACTITWVAAGRAVESDTRIDRVRPGGYFTRGPARRRGLDVRSVMVHESGHTLGFEHVSARSVVMFPAIAQGTVGGRRLGRGDALVNNRRY